VRPLNHKAVRLVILFGGEVVTITATATQDTNDWIDVARGLVNGFKGAGVSQFLVKLYETNPPQQNKILFKYTQKKINKL
jgi:hypothetical protein